MNPAQITHVEGNDRRERGGIYIGVYLTETTKSGESATMVFHDDDALRLFSELRGLGLQH